MAHDEPRKLFGGRARLLAQAVLDPADTVPWDSSPLRSDIPALRAIASALRGELAGDTAAAIAGWQAFRGLPVEQRLLDEHMVDLDIEGFAAWRVRDLSR
jgi:hypothetical protein